MRRVLLVEDLPQVAEHLKGLLAREEGVQVLAVQPLADAAIAQAQSERPDVVLVDALLQGRTSGAQVAKRIRETTPQARIVMVTVPQRPVTPRPEEGIDAVFILPGGAHELANALGSEAHAKVGGQATAVYSPRGGVGKTLLTVNLATALRSTGHTVAVLDAVTQFGSVRHLLPVPAEVRSIVDLPPAGAMRVAMPEALWEGPGGVHYLLAPPRPEQAELVAPSELQNAVNTLLSAHEHVIVDTPARLSDESLAILDAVQAIVLVLAYDAATVASARAALDTFDALGYTKQKRIVCAVSRADEAYAMSRGALEHTLERKVDAEIPTDRATVAASVERKEPFFLASPAAPISRAVGTLATALVAVAR